MEVPVKELVDGSYLFKHKYNRLVHQLRYAHKLTKFEGVKANMHNIQGERSSVVSSNLE